MKERIHYFDVAKGILILMVAYGHVWYTICHNSGFDNIFMSQLYDFSNIWVVFYMPAFFVITGRCSNYNYGWKSFLYKQVKTLLLPAFMLALLIHAIEWLLTGQGFYIGIKVFLKGVSYWFLFALFTAKMIYFIVNKLLGSINKVAFITLLLSLFSVVVYGFFPNIPNYWCWIHALGLIPFLALGELIKKYDVLDNKKAILISGGVYLACLALYLGFGMKIPRITGGIYLPIDQMLPFVIMAITGSVSILAVCKLIGKSLWLESLGKHSLVIYCLHEGMLAILAPWIGRNVVNASAQQAFVYYSMFLIYVIVMSWGISVVLNKKPLSYLIGKF